MWGAAAILITDIYNSCPHSSLYCHRTGRLPDFSFFRTFDCGMVVFRGRDLVEHKKGVFTSARAVNLGAELSWDILPESTVCVQA